MTKTTPALAAEFHALGVAAKANGLSCLSFSNPEFRVLANKHNITENSLTDYKAGAAYMAGHAGEAIPYQAPAKPLRRTRYTRNKPVYN